MPLTLSDVIVGVPESAVQPLIYEDAGLGGGPEMVRVRPPRRDDVAPVQRVEESGIELGEVFWPCTRLLGTSVWLLLLCGRRPALRLLQFTSLWLGRVQSNGIR